MCSPNKMVGFDSLESGYVQDQSKIDLKPISRAGPNGAREEHKTVGLPTLNTYSSNQPMIKK